MVHLGFWGGHVTSAQLPTVCKEQHLLPMQTSQDQYITGLQAGVTTATARRSLLAGHKCYCEKLCKQNVYRCTPAETTNACMLLLQQPGSPQQHTLYEQPAPSTCCDAAACQHLAGRLWQPQHGPQAVGSVVQ